MTVVLKNLSNKFNVDPHKLRKTLRTKFKVPKGRRWQWKEGSKDLKAIEAWIVQSKKPTFTKTPTTSRASSPPGSQAKRSKPSQKRTEVSK